MKILWQQGTLQNLLPMEFYPFIGGRERERGFKALPAGVSYYHKTVHFATSDFIVSALIIYCNTVCSE